MDCLLSGRVWETKGEGCFTRGSITGLSDQGASRRGPSAS